MRKPRIVTFYCRVSTPPPKDGTTLDNQEKSIRRWSEIEGHPVEPEDLLHNPGVGRRGPARLSAQRAIERARGW